MTTLRKTLMAVGFMSIGALGTLGLTAAADRDFDGERAERSDHMRGPHGGPEDGVRALGMAMSRLDLSDEQRDAIKDARQDIGDKMAAARDDAQDDRQALRDALSDGSLNRADVKARIQERTAAAEEMVMFTVDRVFDIYETLDDEQRAELVSMLDEFSQRHSEQRGRRGPHGDSRSFDRDADDAE